MKIIFSKQSISDLERIKYFLFNKYMPNDKDKAKEIIDNIQNGIKNINLIASKKSNIRIGERPLLEKSIKYSRTTKKLLPIFIRLR